MGVRGRVALAGAFVASLVVPIVAASPAFAVNPNATPDFDNDGYADLVVADQRADPGGNVDAGGVHVLYGGPAGPQTGGYDFWSQNSPGVPNASEPGDRFGASWAAGHFNNDAYDDLAIGVPGETLGGLANAGSLTVLYGSAGGLQSGGAQEFTQNSAGIADSVEIGDFFTGYSMVAGDFNGDGRDDVATASINEDLGAASNAGAVHVLPGSAGGLTGAGSDFFTNSTPGIGGIPQVSGRFGYGLAAGDPNGDGRDDLAIMQGNLTVGGLANAGGFNVLYGSAGGLPGGGIDFVTQATPGVPGVPTTGHYFADGPGAFGDFDNDGTDELVIVADYETVGGVTNAGALFVFPGTPAGITTGGLQLWHQNVAGVPDFAEMNDYFGWPGPNVGDFDNNGFDDLAIPISYEDTAGKTDAGILTVLRGGAAGLSTAGIMMFNQSSAGIPGSPQTSGWWTEGIMVPGDFNGDGRDDLGVPGSYQNIGALNDPGTMTVMFGGGAGLSGAGAMGFSRSSPGIVGVNTADDKFGQTNY